MVKRGEIWWAQLPSPVTSEPGYRRPVLIVQSNSFNQSRINTIVAVVITSNMRLSNAPGNVILPTEVTGLSQQSIANVSQVITIDKKFLNQKIGKVDLLLMQQIDEGLKIVLDL